MLEKVIDTVINIYCSSGWRVGKRETISFFVIELHHHENRPYLFIKNLSHFEKKIKTMLTTSI